MRIWVWLFVIVLACGLYWRWGASDQLILAHQVKNEVQKIKSEIANTGSIQNLVNRLKARIDKTPDDPKGWYLLGNLYLSHYELDQAVASYQKANSLKPNNPDIMIKLAEALFLKNNKKLTEESQLLVDKVLKKEPQNINSLNLVALDAFQQGDSKKAIQYWEKVLIQLPIDSDDAKQIEAMIAKAKKISR